MNDPIWQLNAKVLVAHSQTKLRQYREAEQTFEEALVLAKDQRKFTHDRDISHSNIFNSLKQFCHNKK